MHIELERSKYRSSVKDKRFIEGNWGRCHASTVAWERDSLNEPLYSYEFISENPGPVMVVVAGTHAGVERTAINVARELVIMAANNGIASGELHVIPVLNQMAYKTKKREVIDTDG